MTAQKLPLRLRIASSILRRWPLPRGRDRLTSIVGRDPGWPPRGDITFAFGQLVDVSLLPWPQGFRELAIQGIFEDAEVRVWSALLEPGDCVVDGGANMGYWTLVASRLVGPTGEVHAFEPLPRTGQMLERNVRASNATGNVRLHTCALWDRNEPLAIHTFCDDPFGGFTSAGMPGGWVLDRTVEARAVRLDGELPLSTRIALLKLDVEGAELRALRGAEAWLSRDNPPVVTFEYNAVTSLGLGYDAKETLAYLRDLRFECFLVSRHGLRPFVHRNDIAAWSPMVWCFRRGELRDRIARSGLFEKR